MQLAFRSLPCFYSAYYRVYKLPTPQGVLVRLMSPTITSIAMHIIMVPYGTHYITHPVLGSTNSGGGLGVLPEETSVVSVPLIQQAISHTVPGIGGNTNCNAGLVGNYTWYQPEPLSANSRENGVAGAHDFLRSWWIGFGPSNLWR